MESHGEDLRRLTKDDELVAKIKTDYRQARLSDRQRALCEFAQKLTAAPAKMTEHDIELLRAVGLTDGDILDTVQVISYFNYINRLADALGVDPETWMQKVREKDGDPSE
ncbi:MAG: peroxidase-related enzyme [Acidobacteria bacterium]|nr:peroxidase-related enzyme [Acidobacteriota bacterium]